MVDILDKSATGLLKSILAMWDKLGETQVAPNVPTTPLYAIDTLYADNASVNTGEVSGLSVLSNCARLAAYLRDHPNDRGFKALLFKGCKDHVLALVLASYNQKLVAWAHGHMLGPHPEEFFPEGGLQSLAKKAGGYTTLPFAVYLWNC